MIDWLTKLPDGALGILLTAGTWFGFNYAVLGERAMERELGQVTISACVDYLGGQNDRRVVPRTGIGELLGIPELDVFEANLVDQMTPRVLSEAERMARCSCAVASAPRLRFDYALHTASFRIIPVDGIADFRQSAIDAATTGHCSA